MSSYIPSLGVAAGLLAPAPALGLARGWCWAWRSPVRAAGSCPPAVGKPATVLAPPPKGSLSVPLVPKRMREGKGERPADEKELLSKT